MKNLILAFALLLQTVFVFAGTRDNQIIAQATTDNVKMYRQPGTSTELIKSLKTSDKVVVLRKFNSNWTIVTVDGQVGYVLHSELTKPKVQTQTIAMHKTRK